MTRPSPRFISAAKSSAVRPLVEARRAPCRRCAGASLARSGFFHVRALRERLPVGEEERGRGGVLAEALGVLVDAGPANAASTVKPSLARRIAGAISSAQVSFFEPSFSYASHRPGDAARARPTRGARARVAGRLAVGPEVHVVRRGRRRRLAEVERVARPPAERATRKPPPPRLPAPGKTTASANAVATAASTALPPAASTSTPDLRAERRRRSPPSPSFP